MYTFRVEYYVVEKDIEVWNYVRVPASFTIREAWSIAVAKALESTDRSVVIEKLILLQNDDNGYIE